MSVARIACISGLVLLIASDSSAFNSKYHEDLTVDALASEGISNVGAQKVAVAANFLTDRFSSPALRRAITRIPECIGAAPSFNDDDAIVATNAFHFDNLADAAEVRRKFEDLRALSVGFLRRAHTDEERLMVLGVTLHAIQDFYSHSNWVELGHVNEIVDFDHLENLPPDLRTGRTHPMCSITGAGSHDEMNKDHANRAGHEVAYRLAAVASKDWVRRFQSWSPEKVGADSYDAQSLGELTDVYARRAKIVGAWDEHEPVWMWPFGPRSLENDFEWRYKVLLFTFARLGSSGPCGWLNKTSLYTVCHHDENPTCTCESCGFQCSRPTCGCAPSGVVIPIAPAPTPEAKLMSARLHVRTKNENKDPDTAIYVSVYAADRSTLLAQVLDAAKSDSDATEWNNGSEHYLDLNIMRDVNKVGCQAFVFWVGMKANGDDIWIAESATVELFFSDGTVLPFKVGEFRLESEDDGYVHTFFPR